MASDQVMFVSSLRKEKQPTSWTFTQLEGQAGASSVVRRMSVSVALEDAASTRTPTRSHMVTVTEKGAGKLL